VVFLGRDAQQVDGPIRSEGIERVEWLPVESVPGLIAGGQIWNAASVVGLLSLLAQPR
jgi:hypothetical protein